MDEELLENIRRQIAILNNVALCSRCSDKLGQKFAIHRALLRPEGASLFAYGDFPIKYWCAECLVWKVKYDRSLSDYILYETPPSTEELRMEWVHSR